MKPNLSSEDNEQMLLFQWAAVAVNYYPELELMYHVPNEGKRSTVTGSRFKQMGLKPGVPDIVLPVAHGGYTGLYIEMKYGKNKVTENQSRWLDMLKREGNKTAVCYNFEEAKEVITEYLKADRTMIF
ncbi:MAG: VRR-NUC domain-containing protein [Ruminococcus sp.]|nr:VRR-NUC domain-containing protein [Ruminococcus sp.]